MAARAEVDARMNGPRVRLAIVAACTVIVGAVFSVPAGAAETTTPSPIVETLRAAAAAKTCGRHEAALAGTLQRLAAMSIPLEGRLVLVNVASRTLAAYENGEPVLESRVVIGREGWKTPDLSTRVDYVRTNPTWTVPESIVKANGWRAKLRSNPGYFARNGFEVVVGGKRLDPRDVSSAGSATFVQKPGPDNALGQIKIGMVDTGGIYLHDTNDPDAFDRRGVESHGCVRVESIFELAGWMLGKDKSEIKSLVEDDDRTNRKPVEPVRVIVGYFTAWPDGEGKVHYFRDIYHRDPAPASCDQPDSMEAPFGDQDGANTFSATGDDR